MRQRSHLLGASSNASAKTSNALFANRIMFWSRASTPDEYSAPFSTGPTIPKQQNPGFSRVDISFGGTDSPIRPRLPPTGVNVPRARVGLGRPGNARFTNCPSCLQRLSYFTGDIDGALRRGASVTFDRFRRVARPRLARLERIKHGSAAVVSRCTGNREQVRGNESAGRLWKD